MLIFTKIRTFYIQKMSKRLIVVLMCAQVSFGLYAQTEEKKDSLAEEAIPVEIIDAFKAGNSSMLAKWLSGRTLITIAGKRTHCNRQRAQGLLKKFFKDNPPLGFEFIHQGIPPKKNSTDRLLYYIATYRSYRNYNMYILIKRSKKRYQINSISFDEQ